MKLILVLFALLTTASLTDANDASFEGIAGSARPLKGENPWIQMVSEKVILTANADDFTAQADFVFRNHSNRRLSVPMGFPEGNYGGAVSDGPLQKSGFSSFATWVDGQKVVAKRTVLNPNVASNADFDTYWLKTVEFSAFQTRRVRVLARSPYGGRAAWGLNNCLSYDFTGQNWRGNVTRSDLEVHVPQKGLWIAIMATNGQKPLDFKVETGAKRAILKRSWTNWPAKLSVSVGLQRAIPFWLADAERVSNNYDQNFFRGAQTFRVGAKPKNLENYGDFAPDGFVRDGVNYVALVTLQQKLADVSPKTPREIAYDAKNRAYFLQTKVRTLTYRLENSQLAIATRGANGKTILTAQKLPAPPILLRGASDSRLYVPLESAARLLGFGSKVDAKNRLMTIFPLSK